MVAEKPRGSAVRAARPWNTLVKTVDAIPQRAMVFPSMAGGKARQKRGSMGAVSGAPLTVTTYTG